MSSQITSSWLLTVCIFCNKYEDIISPRPWNHRSIPDKIKSIYLHQSVQLALGATQPPIRGAPVGFPRDIEAKARN